MGAAKEVPSPASAHFPLFTAAITVVCACFGSPPGPEIKTEAPLVLKEEMFPDFPVEATGIVKRVFEP